MDSRSAEVASKLLRRYFCCTLPYASYRLTVILHDDARHMTCIGLSTFTCVNA